MYASESDRLKVRVIPYFLLRLISFQVSYVIVEVSLISLPLLKDIRSMSKESMMNLSGNL